jgi:DNA gyrase subunit A
VTDADDLMIINKNGITIRMALKSIRVMGRATQGVRLINLGADDSIAAVTKVPHEEDVVEETDMKIEDEINPEISDESAEGTVGTENEE